MQSLAQGGFTEAQVIAALHAPGRRLRFRYELLDGNNNVKAETMKGVKAGWVSNNALADIKRIARFTLRDGADSINWLSDRIRPYVGLRMQGNIYLEWPQGVFLLSTTTRSTDREGAVWRDVEAYDQLVIVRDDRVSSRYTVAAAVNYIAAVKTLLDSAGIVLQNLTPTDKTLPTALDWPPGTSKLEIINTLLGAINYRSLWFDEQGRAVAEPYVSPATAPVEYTYRDDDNSVIYRELLESLDLFDVPNQWVLVVSEPDRAPLRAVYTNTNPNSPTSTVSRGRTISHYEEYVDAVDQVTLNAKASRLAFEASQVYQAVELETGVMPHHSDSDVLAFSFRPLGVTATFSEVSWELPLQIGGRMRHRIRRVVNV